MLNVGYYLDGAKFAARTRGFVPNKGDSIRFKNVIYDVKSVVWEEDNYDVQYVSIEITKSLKS